MTSRLLHKLEGGLADCCKWSCFLCSHTKLTTKFHFHLWGTPFCGWISFENLKMKYLWLKMIHNWYGLLLLLFCFVLFFNHNFHSSFLLITFHAHFSLSNHCLGFGAKEYGSAKIIVAELVTVKFTLVTFDLNCQCQTSCYDISSLCNVIINFCIFKYSQGNMLFVCWIIWMALHYRHKIWNIWKAQCPKWKIHNRIFNNIWFPIRRVKFLTTSRVSIITLWIYRTFVCIL